MIKTNSVFIVEGKTDKSLLTRYFDTEIVTTNGSYVSRETINYIIALEKHHEIIIITDPDVSGETIANKIIEAVPSSKRVKIDKKHSVKHGKLGLAETRVDLLLEKIMPLISEPLHVIPSMTLDDLLEFEKVNENYKKIIMEHFPIGNTNNKTMMRRLSYLNVTKEMIENLINGQTTND